MFANTPVRADRSVDDRTAVTIRWSVDIIRGRKVEHVRTVEAGSQREAYAAAIEKFTVGSNVRTAFSLRSSRPIRSGPFLLALATDSLALWDQTAERRNASAPPLGHRGGIPCEFCPPQFS